MKHISLSYSALILILLSACSSSGQIGNRLHSGPHGFIETSPLDPAYFQFSDGTPFIPVGLNMISPSGRYGNNTDSAFMEVEGWMKKLSKNGGNYVRIWLSQAFWDVEDQQAGKYSDEKAERIQRFIGLARKYNLRIKMTLEHFRSITMDENPQQWAVKSVYHVSRGGPLDSIRQYVVSPEGRQLFLNKVDFYKQRFGNDTIFFGWELWNEMNAMKGPEDSVFFDWNEKMLKEVKQRFPENLVMQSLGSFDDEKVRGIYKKMMLLPGNEVAQVHRYLDPGASMEVCQMPMDVICSSAINEIRSYHPGKPVILAETGAVEAKHTGPSRYYPVDTAGILLHDILFGPFFSGSAGAGMSWHWDSYVDRNNLWFHFGRFSKAVKGINPIEEQFVPSYFETDQVRIYWLSGRKTTMLWIRDKANNWESELKNGIAPSVLSGIKLDLRKIGIYGFRGKTEFYDPWKNEWKTTSRTGKTITLPQFSRSIVVRISAR